MLNMLDQLNEETTDNNEEEVTVTIEVPEKKVTWKDFTLEEHISAFMGKHPSSRMSVTQIKDTNNYRVTIKHRNGRIGASKMLHVTTDEETGYTFKELK